jgi:hypothetical protein
MKLSSIRTYVVVGIAVASGVVLRLNFADDGLPKLQPPTGFVMIEEDRWNLMADEPDHHIGRAREAYLMMDAKTAAREIRKAAIYLRVAGSHATERARRGLIQAEHDLDHLAKRIESGTIRSVEELDLATARALHALADYQYIKAAEKWREREVRVSGQYLRASVDNLEHAAARTDARMRAATAEMARESRVMANRLAEGTGYVVEEIGTGFEAFGREIERVGMRLFPSREVK